MNVLRLRNRHTRTRLYLSLIGWIIGILWLLPFVGIVMASVRPSAEIVHGWWVFENFNPTIQNYLKVLFGTSLPLARPLLNSTYVAVVGTLLPMIFGTLAGYAFARHYIPFKGMFVVIMLSLLAIPLQMVVVPLYQSMNSIGLVDTFWAVILLDTATAVPWIVFFMMNTIKAQPIENEESAQIDGAGSSQILARIVLPQSVPALLSVFTLQFVWVWVDFFLPLVFLYSEEKFVAVQVIPLLRGQLVANWGDLSAASVLVTAAPLLLFLFLQKYYIRGSVGWVAEK